MPRATGDDGLISDGDEDRRQSLEVPDHLGLPELSAKHHDLALVDAVELEHRLGRFHADERVCSLFSPLSWS